MIALLIALAGAPAEAAQDGQATLKSCDMTPGGWVCHYQMPSVTLLVSPDGKSSPVTVPAAPATLPAAAPTDEVARAEAARQARLIANCADATWLSLCLPADRREARRLKEAAAVQAALRGRVTGLLSEGRCDDAVRTALAGGDLALAREARAFCTP